MSVCSSRAASNMEILGVAMQQFIVANKDPAMPSVQLGEVATYIKHTGFVFFSSLNS